MNDSTAITPLKHVIEIGIRGLPELSANMIAGGLYALKAETPSARYPLLAGSLGSALKSGLSCTIIVPSKPEQFIQRIESFGHFDAQQLMGENRLHVFVTQDEFSKKMFRFGADRFAQELAQFGVPENSFLIFDQADELLSLHDISLALDQVESLRKWFSQWKLTGLLVFSRATDEHSETINALMDSLTGVARLGGGKDGLEITFEYWQSPDGTLAAQNYPLKTLDSGLYEVTTRAAPALQVMGAAPQERREEVEDSEPHFFYMNPDLGSLANQVPGVWQQVDTLIGLLHATRNHRTAITILSFQRDTQLRELAETIHTLRLNLGPRAGIVVQEKDASLRYQNEALLLRLGINLVVRKDVPISRVPLLLESLKGQTFNRDVDINFEAALSNVFPTRLRGYLTALRFEREVQFILDRAQTLNIPSVLIVGIPTQGMSALDILRNVHLTRIGDLNSSDGVSCFLFLNACPELEMRATLNKILGVPAEAVFESIESIVQSAEIKATLAELLGDTSRGELPDYSSVLSSSSDQENSASGGYKAAPQPVILAPLKPPALSLFSKPFQSQPAFVQGLSAKPQTAAAAFVTSPIKQEEPQSVGFGDHLQTPIAGKMAVRRAVRSSTAGESKII